MDNRVLEIDEFVEMNPRGKGQHVSPVEHLSRIAATNGTFLGVASQLLGERPPSVVCFAQLPYTVVREPISMVRPGTSRLFELYFFPATILIQDDGSQQLFGPIQEGANGIHCTQVLSIVKYWGVRSAWYPAYALMVTDSGLRNGQVVPTEESWLKGHRPLNAAAYENDLARRLMLDNLEAIHRALPQDLAKAYTTLLNYFIMPFPGRVAFGGMPVPTLRRVQTSRPSYESPRPEPVNIKRQSIFLSYGGPDEEIAEALRNDLAKLGVNTWWFPADAQWGAKIHDEINRNIMKYDRLLLLCSRRSLIRNGVLHELEEVFEREAAEGGKPIVIPVALDTVLNEQWWMFEPDRLGEPVINKLSDKELSRRCRLATRLSRRVAGDLKGTMPGDLKWKGAINRLLDSLS